MTGTLPPALEPAVVESAPVAAAFAAAGHRFYLVGGIVRDAFVRDGSVRGAARRDDPADPRRVGGGADLDVTTDARPDAIKRIVEALADAVWTQGERFGTIGCRIGGRDYEITTHRTESYDLDSRKPEVAFGETIEDDLSRRDFTVNAMAVEVASQRLVDPFDGRRDLHDRVLRTPLDAETAFSDDPLRMLRAARFRAGYDLTPVPELRGAIETMGDRMEIVSAERIAQELDKLLLLDDPAPGLFLLDETGLMRWVVPELTGGGPSMAVVGGRVGEVAVDPIERWAALLLDVDDPGVRMRSLRCSSAHIDAVRALVTVTTTELRADSGLVTVPEIRRVAASLPAAVPLDRAIDFARAVRSSADASTADLDRLATDVIDVRRAEPDLDDPEPVLDGGRVIALLGIEPGPDVGRALAWLREQRFAEGPLGPEDAETRLVAWWGAGAGSG